MSTLVGETIDSIREKIRLCVLVHRPPISKKRALIWEHLHEVFDKETKEQIKGFVVCKKCEKVMRYDSKTLGTNHLTNHLKTHGNERLHSMNEFVMKTKELTKTDKNMVLNACVNFVCKDLRPYSAVVGDGLIELLQTFMKIGSIHGTLEQSQIKDLLPSVQTISRHVSIHGKELKVNLFAKIRNTLLSDEFLPMTVDIWQDKFKRISYLGITAHFYEEKDSETFLVDKMICMKPIEPGVIKDHAFIRRIIRQKLEEIGIDDFFHKIVFVTDRGSNIRKALCDVQRLNCFPHFLNNVVKAACGIDIVRNIVDRTKCLVRYFKITGLNNKLSIALKSSCPTRFNSILFTFESIVTNWNEVDEILRSLNEIERLECIDFNALKCISEYLKEFEFWTKLSSSSKKPSLYSVWLGIHAIMTHSHINDDDHPIVSLMKVKAFTYITEKFVLTKLHRIATFLHPSYKLLKFASFEQIQKTHTEVRVELSKIMNSGYNFRRTSSSSESSISQFADFYENGDELVEYMQFKCCISPEEIDLIKWWKSKSEEFPTLSKLALRIHAVPGSSTPAERLFSNSGSVITEKRSSLLPDSIEDVLILHER